MNNNSDNINIIHTYGDVPLLCIHNQSYADEVDLDNVLGAFVDHFGSILRSFWDHFGPLYVWDPVFSTQFQFP